MCNVWFTLEICIRFIVSPDKCEFLQSPVNVIDLVATLSFYTDILLQVMNYSSQNHRLISRQMQHVDRIKKFVSLVKPTGYQSHFLLNLNNDGRCLPMPMKAVGFLMIPLLPHRMKCHNVFESGQFGRLCKSGEKTHDSLIIRKMLIGGEGGRGGQ